VARKTSDPYNYPILYDEQYWWKRNDIDFWREMCDLIDGNHVLEIGAGTGRIAKPLLKQDIYYYGIDNSEVFINYTKQHLEDSRASFFKADMQDFNLNTTFDLIFIPFNTFLHNLSTKDAESCLKSIASHMTSQSLFIIDILVPDPLFLYRPENIRFPIMEFHSSQKKTVVLVEETITFDSTTHVLSVRWFYSTAVDKDFKSITFKMKMFYNSEMLDLLNNAGFSIKAMWGGYERERFDEQSSQQIFCCKLA
tara:strand:- start:2188 stop:2943 length:756 start_codon:yes stop_codon:yes gene_type:complete